MLQKHEHYYSKPEQHAHVLKNMFQKETFRVGRKSTECHFHDKFMRDTRKITGTKLKIIFNPVRNTKS